MSLPIAPVQYLPYGANSINPTVSYVLPNNSQQNIVNSLFMVLKSINESEKFNEFLKIFSRSLPYTSMRIIPQFLFSFTMLLDDLWYYRFHKIVYPL